MLVSVDRVLKLLEEQEANLARAKLRLTLFNLQVSKIEFFIKNGYPNCCLTDKGAVSL